MRTSNIVGAGLLAKKRKVDAGIQQSRVIVDVHREQARSHISGKAYYLRVE